MDYEKKYREALERMKSWARGEHPECFTEAQKAAEFIFPELKGSEGEKIRKSLLEYLHTLPNHYAHNGVCASEWTAWLEKQVPVRLSHDDEIMIRQLTEYFTTGKGLQNTNDTVVEWLADVKRKLEKQGEQKSIDDLTQQDAMDIAVAKCFEQGEQKSADNVEPKFKVGNWYQCTKDFFGKGVTFDKNTAYYCANEGCLQNEYGCHIAIVKDLYDNFKLWTIDDAKDGDVLVAHECLVLFREIDGLNIRCYCTYHNLNYQKFYVDTLQNKTAFCPATKEQRDLLFQKMKEAGYEWDAEKKN